VLSLPLPSQKGPAVSLLQSVALHLQRLFPAASQVWCVPQAVVALLKKQPSPSAWQSSDELPEHFAPAAVQLASVLHLQIAAPAVGVVHAWRVPQATAVSAKMQFLAFELSVLQVERLVLVAQKTVPAAPMHSVGGAVQSHAPVGLLPRQSW
jgi:hypothetical protein